MEQSVDKQIERERRGVHAVRARLFFGFRETDQYFAISRACGIGEDVRDICFVAKRAIDSARLERSDEDE